jgi:hypothetical protein
MSVIDCDTLINNAHQLKPMEQVTAVAFFQVTYPIPRAQGLIPSRPFSLPSHQIALDRTDHMVLPTRHQNSHHSAPFPPVTRPQAPKPAPPVAHGQRNSVCI